MPLSVNEQADALATVHADWWEKQRERDARALAKADGKPVLDVVDPLTLVGKSPPERPWLVEGWIPMRQVTLVGGDGGLGKSLLAQQLATAAATDRPWLGLPVRRVVSMCVFCEDDAEEVWRRQEAINASMGLSMSDLADLGWHCPEGADTALVAYHQQAGLAPTKFYNDIAETVSNAGVQLLVLDSLHDLFAGNENSRPETRQFIAHLRDLARTYDCAIVLTAHPSVAGLSSGSGLSGSTAWNNAVRSRLYLTRPKADGDVERDDNVRFLTRMKANYARANVALRLRWNDGAFQSDTPAGGDTITRLDAEHAFLAALDALTEQGRPLSDYPGAGNYGPRLAAGHPACKGFTKPELGKAMERLFNRHVIRVSTYGRAGDQRKRIVRDTTPQE